ncbi:MAG TPA: hypothetical protein QKA14_02475 [Candidatus Megaira endosymbiont of Hartmannula sinica]|nr:hypothetical protein [Candidatus Megaera endosymbiont of Hartmannula sinica]
MSILDENSTEIKKPSDLYKIHNNLSRDKLRKKFKEHQKKKQLYVLSLMEGIDEIREVKKTINLIIINKTQLKNTK